MSQQSKTSPDIPRAIYSRSSIATSKPATGTMSGNGSGRVNVLMDVSNNWSPHSAPGALLYDRPTSEFWRKTTAVVMMPFVLAGAPVLSTIISLNTDQIDSTHKWLKYIFSKPKLLPFNLLAVVIALFLNAWLIYLFVWVILKLYLWGEVPKYFMDILVDMINLIPMLLAVNLFWFKGYILRDVIFKLDTLSMNTERESVISSILKLIISYSMCFSLPVIDYFTYKWRLDHGYTGTMPDEHFRYLPFRIVNTFLIPVYITFLCAIQMRFRRMNVYIKRLIANLERPETSHLREIKFEFKNNGLIIGRINASFNIVMSVFFAVIVLDISSDLVYASTSIFAYIGSVKGMQDDPNLKPTFVNQLVRTISSDILVIGMKMALIGLALIQIMAVNHQSRAAPIHLSDFFSQFQHLLPTDLYHSFRLLHNYMTSRLERTDRPSLVRNAFLSSLPILRNVLSTRIN